MNYYSRHIGDYAKDAGHLSMIEDGAYQRLLDAYYTREGPLPADHKACFKLARATTKAEREAVAYVLGEYFELGRDGYRQKRCDAEIERFKAKQEKARASASARWKGSEGNANGMRTHSESSAEAVQRAPVPNSQEPIAKKEQKQERPPAAAIADPVKGVIDDGIALLAATGVSEAKARSFIGLIRKEVGSDLVVSELIATAERERIAEPMAWLRKAAMQRAGQNRSATGGGIPYVPLPGEF